MWITIGKYNTVYFISSQTLAAAGELKRNKNGIMCRKKIISELKPFERYFNIPTYYIYEYIIIYYNPFLYNFDIFYTIVYGINLKSNIGLKHIEQQKKKIK